MTDAPTQYLPAPDYVSIPLTMGFSVIVDAEDEVFVRRWRWSAQVSRRRDGSVRSVYAVRYAGRKTFLLHRELMKCPDHLFVDHIDCDGLNCRRENMRVATHEQNNHNSRRPVTNTSGIKGVSWDKKNQKWEANIKVSNRNKKLGRFSSIEQAAAAYRDACIRFRGEFGRVE